MSEKKVSIMKVAVLSLILIIFLSGCLARYLEPEKASEKERQPETPLQTPQSQVTSTEETTQEAEITTGTTVEITKTSEPTQQSGPKTYQVNVVQGIGIREGAG